MDAKTMNIPNNKVSLAEKDIEDYLFANPSAIQICDNLYVYKWAGRQVHVPSGIIDLLGYVANGNTNNHLCMGIVVVEVKNVEIDASALTQVCRYAVDIENILAENATDTPDIYRIVVGPQISDGRFVEADALRINIVKFQPQVTIDFSQVYWNLDYVKRRNQMYHQVYQQNTALTEIIDLYTNPDFATETEETSAIDTAEVVSA